MHIMSKRDLLELRLLAPAKRASRAAYGDEGGRRPWLLPLLSLGGFDLLGSLVRKNDQETPSFPGIVIMRIRYVLVLFLLFSVFFGPARTAQSQQSSPDGLRRIVRKTQPTYPELAKRMNLSGTVKVIAVVGADGQVKAVEPMGGSPVLLRAAEEAVSQWKFAPGSESKEPVELHFNP
jgi:TonB family protein